MSDDAAHPSERIRRRRPITGMSAVLLPFDADGEPDLAGLAGLIERTVDTGLIPAVNMDTGHGAAIGAMGRTGVLDVVQDVEGPWVAGAYVDDEPGAPVDLDAYRHAASDIAGRGGLPIVFPSHGLAGIDEADVPDAHAAIGEACGRLLAFELGTMFHPAGRILSLDTYRALVEVPTVVGAKHSSLRRDLEWDRLAVRDAVRPEFWVLTGNDLAIDMVMYGSDYLLGLSAFAPDAFALRDRLWADGDSDFHRINDVLQYLGAFAFRAPTPGYKHDAARFLHLRGWVGSPAPAPGAPVRPDSDDAVLAQILETIEDLLR